MKKLLALALAVVMMMAIALPAFADAPAYATGDEETYTWGDVNVETAAPAQDSFDQVVLEYGVHQAYEVTIPADIQFGYVDQRTNADKFTLTDVRNVAVSNIVIAKNETFVMTVESAEGWVMADTNNISDDVNYTATLGTLKYTDAEKTAAQADVTRPNAVFNSKYDNTPTITDDDVVCTVLTVAAATGNIGTNANNDANIDITFATKGTAQEGLYVDTLTFNVSIEVNYNPDFTNEATGLSA